MSKAISNTNICLTTNDSFCDQHSPFWKDIDSLLEQTWVYLNLLLCAIFMFDWNSVNLSLAQENILKAVNLFFIILILLILFKKVFIMKNLNGKTGYYVPSLIKIDSERLKLRRWKCEKLTTWMDKFCSELKPCLSILLLKYCYSS